MDAIVDRLSGLGLPAKVSAALESAANQVSAATRQQKNKCLTQLYWAGKNGKDPDPFPQDLLFDLEEEGLIKKTRHANSRFRLTEKGVDYFAKISKKKKELVDNNVRRHAAVEQAHRAINVATQAALAVQAAGKLGQPSAKKTIITIPLPAKYAGRFPDPAVHNHGFGPHLTMLTIGSKDYSEGELSEIVHRVRAAGKTIPPFRVYVDPNSGLRDFGPSDSGEMALWLPARSEPRGELERLHRMLRLSLEREGVTVDHKDSFTPHVTWAYVSNDIQEDTRRRLDGHVSDRFREGFWFDVRDVVLSLSNGSSKHIRLSPVPRKSIY